EPAAAPAGARAYNEPAAAPAQGEPADRLTVVIAGVAQGLGRDVPRRDRRLDAAAEALARTLPDEGHTPFDLVEFAVQHQGLVEPAPHLLIAIVPDEVLPAFESDLRERVPGVLKAGRYRRLGIGSVPRPEGRRVVIAFQETFIATDPFPRGLPAGGAARLRGRVDRPFTSPRVFITRPDGSVDKVAPGGAGEAFDVRFLCSATGRHQLEVTADDPHGATVLANFPVFCGVPVPTRAVVASGDDAGVTDAGAAEQRLLVLLNADRVRARLKALAWDERLGKVARAHSDDMLAGGFVGHISPRSGDPAARAARAGLRPQVLLENVARAYSLGEAQRGLMQSPGHRRNCLSPDVTRVGIGLSLGREVGGRREFFVTQLFAGEAPEARRTK
ncbi:MAG: hypothetical protein HY906_11750, partial [Deltaproteobacteria bacterium]|nr:hypothetical protein [Deltaproteobacteria bacterium]